MTRSTDDTPNDDREERLSRALRDNLRRRKAQRRARASEKGYTATETTADDADARGDDTEE